MGIWTLTPSSRLHHKAKEKPVWRPPGRSRKSPLVSQPTPPADTSPEDVLDLYAACLDYVERALGTTLDGSAESLAVVDHWLVEAGREKERPAAQELVLRAAAAYFGEVLLRRFDCFWHREGDDITTYTVRFRPVFLSVSPYALAAAALGGPGDPERDAVGLAIDEAELDEIADHLRGAEVPEDEFYRLSTRLEVIEIVVDQLKARAERRGTGDVTFEDPDYEDL